MVRIEYLVVGAILCYVLAVSGVLCAILGVRGGPRIVAMLVTVRLPFRVEFLSWASSGIGIPSRLRAAMAPLVGLTCGPFSILVCGRCSLTHLCLMVVLVRGRHS